MPILYRWPENASASRWTAIGMILAHQGIARGLVNEGSPLIGDDIMRRLVAGDTRDSVRAALWWVVSA